MPHFSHRPLTVLIGISLIIHCVMMVTLTMAPPPEHGTRSTQTPLQIALQTAGPLEPTGVLDPPEPGNPALHTEPEVVALNPEPVKKKPTEARTAHTTPLSSHSQPSTPKRSTPTVSGSTDIQLDARRHFRKPGCTEKEEFSAVIDCQSEHFIEHRPMADLVATLMPISPNSTPGIGHRLDQVDQLLAQASNLAELDPQDPVQAALIAQQRQHLREEVMRIDQQLASVNLLRVFPMAAKFVRELEKARE